MSQSRLNEALHTASELLTDEQKELLRENKAALSPAEIERLTHAGIFEPEAEETEDAPAEGAEAAA